MTVTLSTLRQSSNHTRWSNRSVLPPAAPPMSKYSWADANFLEQDARPVPRLGLSHRASAAVPSCPATNSEVPSLTVKAGDSPEANVATWSDIAFTAVSVGGSAGAAMSQLWNITPSHFFLTLPRAANIWYESSPNTMSPELSNSPPSTVSLA